jgi:hypothetical protein
MTWQRWHPFLCSLDGEPVNFKPVNGYSVVYRDGLSHLKYGGSFGCREVYETAIGKNYLSLMLDGQFFNHGLSLLSL